MTARAVSCGRPICRTVGAREDRTSVKVLCLLLMHVYAVLQQRCNPRYLFDYMHLSVAQVNACKTGCNCYITADRYHGSSLMLQLPLTSSCRFKTSSSTHSPHCLRPRRWLLSRSAASKAGTGFGVPNNTAPGKPIQLARAYDCSTSTMCLVWTQLQ